MPMNRKEIVLLRDVKSPNFQEEPLSMFKVFISPVQHTKIPCKYAQFSPYSSQKNLAVADEVIAEYTAVAYSSAPTFRKLTSRKLLL